MHSPATRRGSAAMLITVMMFVFVVTAAITVDYAYMQLVRTELRAATDAAAKAGAEALSRTQDTCSAKDEAVRYAACNTVGGRALRLSSDDIIVGRVKMNGAGKWQFRENEEPYNAVKVNSTTGDAVTGVPLYFSRLFSEATFRPSYQATAGQQEVEVCLCIDRSGSMNFDMSGSDWTFHPAIHVFRPSQPGARIGKTCCHHHTQSIVDGPRSSAPSTCSWSNPAASMLNHALPL